MNGVKAESCGKRTRIRGDGMWIVRLDNSGREFIAHPKQCRKLKEKPRPEPKKPRQVWMPCLYIDKAIKRNKVFYSIRISKKKLVWTDVLFREVTAESEARDKMKDEALREAMCNLWVDRTWTQAQKIWFDKYLKFIEGLG